MHPNHAKRPTVKEAATILEGKAPRPALPARNPSGTFGLFSIKIQEIPNFFVLATSLELDDTIYDSQEPISQGLKAQIDHISARLCMTISSK